MASAPFFMNQILFGQSNLLEKNGGSLAQLNAYMLTPENWQTQIKVQEAFQQAVQQAYTSPLAQQALPSPLATPVRSRYKPRMKDSIFWCIYTEINDEPMGETNLVNVMMHEKRTISEFFNQNPNLLKNSNHKITLAKINEIRCNLMTKQFMDSIDNFIPCSIYYKRPIYVLFEDINAYMKFVDKNYVSDDVSDAINESILIYASGGRFSRETCRSKVAEFLQTTSLSLFYMEHYEKLLSGVSTYKLDELKQMYATVFLNVDETLKKQEYYEKVLVKCHTVVNEKIR
jgi:hypothetical protein